MGSRVVTGGNVLFQELQGEAVLLNLDTGIYIGLDRMATRMWQLMKEHGALTEVLRGIMDEFDVAEPRCAADILAFAHRLQDQGLLAAE